MSGRAFIDGGSWLPENEYSELFGHWPTVESPLDPENECRHGRLPADRTPACGCWPDLEAAA